MIRLTLICDDCGVDKWAEAFTMDDLDLDVIPDDWIETPAGKIYCAGCKFKHGAELAEGSGVEAPKPVVEGGNVEIDDSGRIEKREGAQGVEGVAEQPAGGEAGQPDAPVPDGEPAGEARAQAPEGAGENFNS